MNSNNKIIIYGVPGSGKTRFSKLLGKKLNLPVIEADKIKDKAQMGKTKQDSPFLFLGTCQAYKLFGPFTEENVIKGLLAVREALRNDVIKNIESQGQFVLEGAFLDPLSLKNFGELILLIVTDEEKHKKQYFRHREKLLDFSKIEFKVARIIQQYLINEAKELGIQIKDV